MVRVTRFKRKNGVWYVRYWLSGRPVDESTRTKSEAAAESIRVRRELEINAGIEPLSHANVGGLIPKYLAALPPGTSEKHRHEASRVLRVFVQLCGRKRRDGSHSLQTQQVTPETLDAFVRRRAQTQVYTGDERDRRGRRIVRRRSVSNVTLRTELRYLSGFFNWCCRQRPRLLRENPIPLSNASKLKNDARPHFMVTDAELRALLSACTTAHQYAFLLLGWWTGARRGELLALHFYHFDFAAGTLDVRHMKNNTVSVLPVSARIIRIVKGLYDGADEAARLFASDPFAGHGFARLCRRAGVRHHRFHDLRISTSMKIKSGGFDASLAGLWVGNQATTNRAHYSDLTPVAQQIGSLLELSNLPPVPERSGQRRSRGSKPSPARSPERRAVP